MSEKIEFDATVVAVVSDSPHGLDAAYGLRGRCTYKWAHPAIVIPNAQLGTRYHVTLTPVADEPELKPCPFCGGPFEFREHPHDGPNDSATWSAECKGCGIETPSQCSRAQLTEVLNRRAD